LIGVASKTVRWVAEDLVDHDVAQGVAAEV
jgi:hypothetical protein